jgi:hypothetical protein
MSDIYSVNCLCGYKEAKAKYYEKDTPYSSKAIWTFSGLKCNRNPVEKPGSMSLSDALNVATPKCPKCNIEISEESFVTT